MVKGSQIETKNKDIKSDFSTKQLGFESLPLLSFEA